MQRINLIYFPPRTFTLSDYGTARLQKWHLHNKNVIFAVEQCCPNEIGEYTCWRYKGTCCGLKYNCRPVQECVYLREHFRRAAIALQSRDQPTWRTCLFQLDILRDSILSSTEDEIVKFLLLLQNMERWLDSNMCISLIPNCASTSLLC